MTCCKQCEHVASETDVGNCTHCSKTLKECLKVGNSHLIGGMNYPLSKFGQLPDGSFVCKDCNLHTQTLADQGNHPCEVYMKLLKAKAELEAKLKAEREEAEKKRTPAERRRIWKPPEIMDSSEKFERYL